MIRLLLPLALLLPGCAMKGEAPPAAHHSPNALESIRYETSPCFGTCPIYNVTVSSAGKGIFQGQRFTSANGTETFAVTREQFDAFARALAPYRGKVGGQAGGGNCKRMHTDDITVRVTWTATNGRIQKLSHYFGCDSPEYDAMEAGLRDAPSKLPIGDMIGQH